MAAPDSSGTDPTLLAEDAGMSATALPSPTVVADRYEILGLLGAGGMGRVYRARDRELDEIVALKVLHHDFVDSEEMVERFRQEVRLARKVTHRNVARTFDIGEHEGGKFLTMELVIGEPLSARLERERLGERDAVAIAREVLAGMSAAHAAGIVHRDLKPDNVLIESGGRVVVTDFGIARPEAPDAAGRTAGRPIGTPAYMAPEQLRGGAGVDLRADVYAFGAMLFEMLTGRRAWPGSSPYAVAAARLVEPPPDPLAVRPELTPALATVVRRCLARERDERYTSCVEIDRALADSIRADGIDAVAITDVAPPAVDVRSLAGSSRERSVAVMPFRNVGPREDAYFALGLTEDLVDALSVVRGLRVRGRGYADDSDRDVVDTGRRLGVDVVVDGSVRRSGDRMRVSARLVGVADGFQIWSSRFERPAADAFAQNDDVANAIAKALTAERDEAPRAQPTDPLAIDFYFRAKQAIGGFWAEGTQGQAAELFRQALARAPDDPTLLAGYVHAQIGRDLFAPLDAREASSLVHRALVAGPTLPGPWVALAAVRSNHHDDAAGAVRALRRALELGPSYSDAHDLAGRILLEADVWEDAVAHLDRAIWLDPLQSWARVDRMRAAALTEDWGKAEEIFESGSGQRWEGHRTLHQARLWSWPGAPETTCADLPESALPHFHIIRERYLWARQRRRTGEVPSLETVREPFNPFMERPSNGRLRRFFLQMSAEVAAIAGQDEGALALVHEAVREGLRDLSWMNRLRLLDPFRDEPEFEVALRTVEARAQPVVRAWHAAPETIDEALASLGERA